MEINYPNIKIKSKLNDIIGISVNAYDRIGLEAILPKYTIITIHTDPWAVEACATNPSLNIISLERLGINTSEVQKNTESIVNTPGFMDILLKFEHPEVLVYKPTLEAQEVFEKMNIKVIANKFEVAKYLENKKYFRERFSNFLKFPPFKILTYDELKKTTYEFFTKDFGNKIVIQDERESGGKGTYIIENKNQYDETVNKLGDFKDQSVVVSKFIEGEVISIQCCQTKYGLFNYGFQEQVISDELVLNPEINGKGTFTGGVWRKTDFKLDQDFIDELNKLGEELTHEGYKGIFGLDIIFNGKQFFILEMNARTTGMTPMITQIQLEKKQIPFALLHLLELGDYDYEIENLNELLKYPESEKSGSYLLLMNKKNYNVQLKEDIKPGVYEFRNGTLEFIKFGLRIDSLENKDQILIIGAPSTDEIKEPGKRLLRIISKDSFFDNRERFKHIIEAIENNYFTKQYLNS